MSHRTHRGTGRRLGATIAGSGLLLGLLASVPAAAAPSPAAVPGLSPAAKALPTPVYDDGRYIVLLNQVPTAAYDGRIAGYAASKPAEGEQFDADSRAARRYDDRLEQLQDEVLADVGVPESDVSADFTTVTNGFTVELTGAEATEFAKNPDVLSVTEDELLQPTTNESPDFLELTGEDGLWSELGGVGTDGAGSGTVIGVVDSGIWPESQSFRGFEDDDQGRDATAAEYDYTGICDEGADGSFADACNNKLLGGRYYVEGFGAENLSPEEFLSPRDAGGHGTHTASTAAGRHVEDVEVDGIPFGDLAGMAPGARLAAYKVCWEGSEFSGCFTSDSVKAINDAVADGVDAINYSISGTPSDYTNPVEIAFLNAATANVFVAASSGNSGPAESTTNHPSPWLTTVAASTHKISESTLELGNGERFIGASTTAGIDMTSTVLAVESAAEGVDPADAQQCFPDTLDPEIVTGKIVVCDRGIFARVEKSINVRDAGGVGLILVNPTESSVNADLHVIPSIHLDVDAYQPIYDYVGGNPDATSAILAGVNEGSDTQVPEVIAFSSRGPSLGADGDILKPDISAPGVDVLAAVVPFSNNGRDYDLYSGTSMSSPHIAGLSLLLRQQNPDWTPMEQKSAMMTTAYDHATTTDAFEQGAGFVDPSEFSEPGLVYPADIDDWAGFLLGQGVDIGYPGVRPIEATQLNQASIAIGELTGTETVRRTVRNVGDSVAFYSAEITGLDGIDAEVRPARLVVAPGSTASFDVTFTYAGADFGEYAQGHLTWTSGGTEVRSPIVVNPVAVSAPEEVNGEGTDGSLTYDITAGYDGPLELGVFGLNEGEVNRGNVEQGELAPGTPTTDGYEYTVEADTSLLRFDLDAVNEEGVDLDLYVLGPDPEGGEDPIQYVSATGDADERIDIVEPFPGEYTVFVHAFGAPTGGADYVLTNYSVSSVDEGNLTVDPASLQVEAGETYPITLTWSGLNEGPYLGWVDYTGTGEFTIVSIDAGDGSGGGGGDDGGDAPAVEFSTTRPTEAGFGEWFTYEVQAQNQSDTDLGTADWMLSVEHEEVLGRRDVTVQLITDEGRETVPLTADGRGLSAILAEDVAIPAGADLTFEVRMRARIEGELTFTDRLVGDQVDETATSTLEVTQAQQGRRGPR